MIKIGILGASRIAPKALVSPAQSLAGEVRVEAVAARDPARAAETAAKYEIPVFATAEELLAADLKLNAATVSVPTVHHHAVASVLLDAGLDLAKARLSLLRALGHMEDWLRELHEK